MRLPPRRSLVAAGIVVGLALPWWHGAGAAQDTVEIPDSAKGLRNPLTASIELLRPARALWRSHCETCHGVAGRGDGPNARLHEQRKSVAPKDLTDAGFQRDITDGEIFWRITNGIVDEGNIIMPPYRDKIPAESERWQLVLFVRELGRAAPRPASAR
jgi:mono/diheme cytochrome c family protein